MLPKRDPRPVAAVQPRNREEKRPEGKAGSSKDEGWEEF
jgi:hypothetical protein